MTQYITFGMTIRKEFGDVLFSLPFRWSVSDERSFAYAQDDKGKEFGMTFFVFVIPRNDSDEESYSKQAIVFYINTLS